MIKGYELVEKMYSDYDEYEDTKLYSTGDDYLDELLERAFCEGYEYAQREFGNFDGIKRAITQHERNRTARVIRATRRNAQASGVSVKLPGQLGREAKDTFSALRDQAATAQANLPKKGATLGDMKTNRQNLGVLKTHDATKDFFSGKKPFK